MHRVSIAPRSVAPATPISIEAHANVTDVNRQTWSAHTSMLVHAGATYVGVKPERLFVEQGKPAVFELIAVDVDGKPETGRTMQLTVERIVRMPVRGSWHEEKVREADVALSSASTPIPWTFTPRVGAVGIM
jgi:hypothetical protein